MLSYCPVKAVLPGLSGPLSLQAELYRLTCPAEMSRPSCPHCSVPTIVCWLSSTLLPCYGCPVPAVQSFLSCSVLSVLSRMICEADLYRLACPYCPVLDVLSRLFFHGELATVVLFLLSSQAFLFQLVLSSYTSTLLLSSLIPAVLSSLIPTVLSYMPCLGCLVPDACPSCPIRLSYTDCPALVVLSWAVLRWLSFKYLSQEIIKERKNIPF